MNPKSFQLLLFLLAGALAPGTLLASETADTIYTGGNILTIHDASPAAEALAVKGGKILAVGAKADVLKTRSAATRLVDLGGKTLIPGFVDAHSHFYQVGLQAVSANLLPPPDGPASSIAEIQEILRQHVASSPFVKEHRLAIGWAYDDSQLAERRAPNRQELDAVSTAVPIVLTHQSGHLGAYNSRALELAGITAESPDPAGGRIQREANGGALVGVLEETAHFIALLKLLPKFTPEQSMDLFDAAQGVYAGYGYTTVQEGAAQPSMTAELAAAARAGRLKLDVVVFPELTTSKDDPVLKGPLLSRQYSGHFRIGGVKLILDGSPQGKTAWFTKPYFKVPEGQKPDYSGYPAYPKPGETAGLVALAYQNNWPLLVHANGDAAIQQLIDSVRAAEKAFPGQDRRTVMIHGQYMRADQIPQVKAAGIFPALFPMHTFYWGDWHRESVAGQERAEFLSPTRAVLDTGMRFSIHHDAPVTLPNSLTVLATAVNRTTRSGHVLGPDQRLTPLQALRAMTLWPAYQYFEEKSKGSLEVGKLADLVILDRNPLTVDPKLLKEIKVLETIKEGKTIYTATAH